MKQLRILLIGFILIMTYSCSLFAQDWNQKLKALAYDRAGSDHFGRSVAISNDYAVIGAYMEDHDANGENRVWETGSVYVYKKDNGNWSFHQKIVHNDREQNDMFGSSVAIQNDLIAVGAEGKYEDLGNGNELYMAGAVYIFKNNSGVWEQAQKLTASDREGDSYFGSSISISDDYLIVGSERKDIEGKDKAGAAYIFKNTEGSWLEIQKLTAPDPESNNQFGGTVSISGDDAFVGSYSDYEDINKNNFLSAAGAVYIYHNNGVIWELTQKITHSDRKENDFFGCSVDIFNEYAVIGAIYQDFDEFGNDSLHSAGAAYIFKNIGGTWSEIQKIVASDRKENDNFGSKLAIYDNNILVGVPFESENGATYVFKNTEGNWSQVQKLVASDGAGSDNFGGAVAIYNSYCIVGAYGKSYNNSNGVGAAYFFRDDSDLTSIEENSIPSQSILLQNAPNPFSASTTINYQIPVSDHVRLVVYDAHGREIKTLVNKYQNIGSYTVGFDGNGLPCGMYYYQLSIGPVMKANKMLLIK